MALLDPKERSGRGRTMQAEVFGEPVPEPQSLFEESWRDFVFAEVWTRPVMPRRARYLVSLASAVLTGADNDLIDGYVRGALKSGALSLTELREAALHLGPYTGWARGARLDKAVTRAVQALGIKGGETAPIRAEPWNPEVRDAQGREEFAKVMTFGSGPPATPYLEAIHNFVFGEMWSRRALNEPSRRWLTLVGVCDAGIEIPIKSHVHAAMASGNCTPEEMQEFVLAFALFHGWPKASLVQSAVFAMIEKVKAGLPWQD
ncbi:MAG: carboxymuconolactone decarboxylase family protein [Novosphingobium sp.]|nr:carboxymuconolactone decarboxylase family protein [Novosphingobium sp.]